MPVVHAAMNSTWTLFGSPCRNTTKTELPPAKGAAERRAESSHHEYINILITTRAIIQNDDQPIFQSEQG